MLCRLEVGTESSLDRSKSIKSCLMPIFEKSGNTNVLVRRLRSSSLVLVLKQQRHTRKPALHLDADISMINQLVLGVVMAAMKASFCCLQSGSQ